MFFILLYHRFRGIYRKILIGSQKINAMYAKGMSQRDIEDTVREIYGSEISQGMISKITDKILPEVNEWQNRPLEKIYPVVFFDGIVVNSRQG